MKQIIKEALDAVKKEKLYRHIFQQLDKNLTLHKRKKYPDSIFFAWEEKDYYVMECTIKSGILYWDTRFWVNFFDNFSMEVDECERVLKMWVEKTLKCEVDTTYDTTPGCGTWWKRP